MGALLVVGTRKGLFLVRGDDERRSFEVEGPFLPGWQVNHAIVDPRDGSLYACANSWVYGGTVQRSTDMGKTWERSEGLGLPEESGLKLASTWHLEPGHPSEPGTLWLGGEPGVLFRSDDSGASWQVNEAVLGHETREKWSPGAGGLITHSITLDPDDAQRLWIGISAAGVFRIRGRRRLLAAARISGTEACFFPDDKLPRGRPVRAQGARAPRPAGTALAAEPLRRLPLRRRRRQLGAAGRERAALGLRLRARARPRRPGRAFVIPEEGAENRVTCDGRLGIYTTADAGASWQLIVAEEQAWAAVLREAMSQDDEAVYAGTQSGHVYALRHDEVVEAARHLPPILSVEAATAA